MRFFDSSGKNSGGFTLVELLTVSVVMIILVTICLKTYMRFDYVRVVAQGVLETQNNITEFENYFRDTLRSPGEIEESFQDFASSDSLLIVRHSGGNSVSLIGTALNPDELSIVQWRKNADLWEIHRLKTFPFENPEIQIGHDERNLVSISLESKSFGASHSIPDKVMIYATVPEGNIS